MDDFRTGARAAAVSIPLALGIDDGELSRIVTRAADVLCLTDDDGRLLGVNRQGRLVLGYSPEEVSGLTLFDVDPELPGEKLRELRATIPRGSFVEARRRLRCKDGTRLAAEVRIGIVDVDGRGETLLFAARDIAERDELEKRLVDALAGAEEAARTKSAFLGNLSHEIRTPLTAIVGYSSLVVTLLEGAGHAEATTILGRLQGATQRLLNMIQSTLDLSTIHRGDFRVRPEVVDLASVVEQEARRFRADAEKKGLELRVRAEASKSRVRFDPYCLSGALQKLLDNAVKFTEHGTVTVTLAPTTDGGLDLDVEDTGIGIGDGYLAQVFEPFTQEDPGLSRRFEGSGIGLALAKRFAESNGATLSVTSEKQKGSRFRMHFPKPLIVGRGGRRAAG